MPTIRSKEVIVSTIPGSPETTRTALAMFVSTTYGPTDMPAVSASARLLVMVPAPIALILFSMTIARTVATIG